LAAAAAVLPGRAPGPSAEPASAGKPAPEAGTGYRLTEHVKRYYATTRI
jgi:hypothetical protein